MRSHTSRWERCRCTLGGASLNRKVDRTRRFPSWLAGLLSPRHAPGFDQIHRISQGKYLYFFAEAKQPAADSLAFAPQSEGHRSRKVHSAWILRADDTDAKLASV